MKTTNNHYSRKQLTEYVSDHYGKERATKEMIDFMYLFLNAPEEKQKAVERLLNILQPE